MYTPEQAAHFDIVINELKPNGSKNMGILSSDLNHKGVMLHTILNIMEEEELVRSDKTPFNAMVKLLKRGYEVAGAGGWILYEEKERENERIKAAKELEQETRATITHEKTLLDIKKIQGDIERSDLQTEVLKKQDIKLASDIENITTQTDILKGQLRSINRQNIFFWVSAVATVIGIIVGTYQVINIRSQLKALQPKQPTEEPQLKINTTKPASNQIQLVDSTKKKN